MDNKKTKIVAVLLVFILIILTIVAAVQLGPSWIFFFIFGIVMTATFGIIIWLIIQCHLNQTKMIISEGQELRVDCSFLRKVAGVPIKFRYKELEQATDNFNSLVGRGASGSVFKGILNDGTHVAAKRIDSEERGEKEFRSEISAIASVQHVNLVRLIGYCIIPGGPRFLVYEFIQNGTLDGWIFPRRERSNKPGGCLPWRQRYKVAVDVAKALSYLHHDCRSRILHLDVKPENILLDDHYRAVVSDFGLSKLMGKEQSRIVTRARGTRGYLAPELILEQGISEKSDVYSYGMVVLEIIGGRRNVCQIDSRTWEYFPKIVIEKLKKGNVMEVVDRRLVESGGIEENEVRKLAYIALWCIQENARSRPSMTRVVDMLEGNLPVDEPPENQMIMVDLLLIDKEKPHNQKRPQASPTDDKSTQTNDTIKRERERGVLHPTRAALVANLEIISLITKRRIWKRWLSGTNMSLGGPSVASGGGTARRAFEFGRTYVVKPKGKHQATIVWLHGLGDNGASWSQILETLPLPNIKWICPTAPARPISLFGGFPSNAWFDVHDLREDGPDDMHGMDATAVHVANLLSTEPADIKIAVGGFSMGAATSLYYATCFISRKYGNGNPFSANLSAVVGLSGWLPCGKSLSDKIATDEAASRAASLPILLCHGTADDVVPFKFGEKSAQKLTSSGFRDVTFKSYNGLGHYTNPQEIDDVCNWLASKLNLDGR
ncbi:hypothetical protein Nepgr_006335 [Nepenthes gracilis]|uniref:Protein kinase domain-containing protein n=1 Tax=Nepenthes gracilis TaxID=150966 RepID=A0AAD3S4Z0_NEPGR|nr:hypothetical protein Nepgr_006335 [Nepenthes gracilis]